MTWQQQSYDRIREQVRQQYHDERAIVIDLIAKDKFSQGLNELYQNGEITIEEFRQAESQFGTGSSIRFSSFASYAAQDIMGFVTSTIGGIGSEIGKMYEDFHTLAASAISTDQESGAIGVDERVWDYNDQDSSIDLWDDIGVEREISVDDDISVTDDIDVTEETEMDEPLFFYEEEVPDLNPVDDFEDLLYPPEYDIKSDDIEDLIAYPEQELDDAVAFLENSSPVDSLQEVVSDDQFTPMVTQLFEDQQDDPFGAVIDLQTQTDDVFSDIVNQATEDHLGVLAFQFFDSDNIIFDKFSTSFGG